MLTRLRIRGFKNLANVDVSFGPFTCIAGANGAGKSNLFDAITFLGALADRPLMEAAKCVRDERHHATDIGSLFLKLGTTHADEMSFDAEMLVPESGEDDLGQTAKAAITFLRYQLTLRHRHDRQEPSADRLEIAHESLEHINLGEARKHLPFPHSAEWRKSVAKGRRSAAFLSTDTKREKPVIRFHQDGRSGKPREYRASRLPRTVLSSSNATESPTALLARREMQSWRLLQLEPSALREPDTFNSPTHLGQDGSCLASTLHHLAKAEAGNGSSTSGENAVCVRVANQLSNLVGDVAEVRVDEDRRRELFTVQVRDRNRNLHAARALSDGTLRFLALAVLELDPHAQGLLCFEEPENGIHPERISAMLKLLRNLCVDTDEKIDPDNPLRQVIVNTHSPAVVGLVDDKDLLIAHPREVLVDDHRCPGVAFSWLPKTWRATAFPDVDPVSRGMLGAYLNPLAYADEEETPTGGRGPAKSRRVKDRHDLQKLLAFPP